MRKLPEQSTLLSPTRLLLGAALQLGCATSPGGQVSVVNQTPTVNVSQAGFQIVLYRRPDRAEHDLWIYGRQFSHSYLHLDASTQFTTPSNRVEGVAIGQSDVCADDRVNCDERNDGQVQVCLNTNLHRDEVFLNYAGGQPQQMSHCSVQSQSLFSCVSSTMSSRICFTGAFQTPPGPDDGEANRVY